MKSHRFNLRKPAGFLQFIGGETCAPQVRHLCPAKISYHQGRPGGPHPHRSPTFEFEGFSKGVFLSTQRKRRWCPSNDFPPGLEARFNFKYLAQSQAAAPRESRLQESGSHAFESSL